MPWTAVFFVAARTAKLFKLFKFQNENVCSVPNKPGGCLIGCLISSSWALEARNPKVFDERARCFTEHNTFCLLKRAALKRQDFSKRCGHCCGRCTGKVCFRVRCFRVHSFKSVELATKSLQPLQASHYGQRQETQGNLRIPGRPQKPL